VWPNQVGFFKSKPQEEELLQATENVLNSLNKTKKVLQDLSTKSTTISAADFVKGAAATYVPDSSFNPSLTSKI
jgi:hypothetical protein